MLYIVTRWEYTKTTIAARRQCPGFGHLSYDQLFNRSHLPRGRYIFADLDRLSLFETQLAAIVYRKLASEGMLVYNDPASVLLRFELLRVLHREGINDFNVYHPQYGQWPERYPVFLRQNAFHRGALTECLEDRSALEAALANLLQEGMPQANTMAVEYAAEASEDGLFRKFSVYRIGDHYFQDTTVNQQDWVVKSGQTGVASDAFYKAESEAIDTVPFEREVKRVFEIAGVQYGRVDIGIYQGRPQFYEINTNPNVSFITEHRSEYRTRSRQCFIRNYSNAIAVLASDLAGPSVKIEDAQLHKRRRNFRWFLRLRSRPSY
jgi:hypothetical protein